MEREVLTVRQAAVHMQASTDTVYRLVSSGEPSVKKVGRIRRFHCSAIQSFPTSLPMPEPKFRENEAQK